ncbi:FAD-dependent oxidoreductase [Streptomyces sp. NPDC050625]|uniref:FAD-dependent oxidoreductase n=1 Tax=Streptomyces sp. NPDC050625 TaxID=3154629 RepID=UPI00341D70C7
MSRGIGAGSVVIVGSGQAGVQVADSLRAGGHPGQVVLLGDEPGLPYQHPPLSKDFVAASGEPRPRPLRSERFFADREIDYRPGAVVTGISRARRTVVLESGREIDYASRVLATGTAPRSLPIAGAELVGVLPLRTLADARELRAALTRRAPLP